MYQPTSNHWNAVKCMLCYLCGTIMASCFIATLRSNIQLHAPLLKLNIPQSWLLPYNFDGSTHFLPSLVLLFLNNS